MKRLIAVALVALLLACLYAIMFDIARAAAHPRKPRHHRVHYVANGTRDGWTLLCPSTDGWVYGVKFRCEP